MNNSNTSLFLRSRQVGVPAGPREPGNLPEGLRPDRALLQHWRRGPVSGSRRRSAAAAVPLPAVRGPDGRLPAIMLNPPSPVLHLHPHLGSFFSLPRSRVTTTLGSPPPFSPSHHQRGWFNHYHDYEKCNIMGAHLCECVQRGSSSAVLSASLWRFHSSFCLAPISPLRLNPSCLPRAQHLLLANCPSNNDPVLLFGHPPWLIPYKNHLSTSPRIGDPCLWWSGSL